MKGIIFAVAVMALALPCVAGASQATDTFATAVVDSAVPCKTMVYKADLNDDLQAHQADINARFGERSGHTNTRDGIAECFAAAKVKAAAAYKVLEATAPSKDVLDSAKGLLAAFYAYVATSPGGVENQDTREDAAFRKARADFEVTASVN